MREIPGERHFRKETADAKVLGQEGGWSRERKRRVSLRGDGSR